MATTYIPHGAILALALPQRRELTDQQQRGAHCIACAAELTSESAVDLGEQHDGEEGAWFPRLCVRCAASRAHAALFDHAGICEQCADDRDICEVFRALYRLVRQEWR